MKVYIVVTVEKFNETDLCTDVIGVYDDKRKANALANKITKRSPVDGIDYTYLYEFREAVVLSFDLNSHIIHEG